MQIDHCELGRRWVSVPARARPRRTVIVCAGEKRPSRGTFFLLLTLRLVLLYDGEARFRGNVRSREPSSKIATVENLRDIIFVGKDPIAVCDLGVFSDI